MAKKKTAAKKPTKAPKPGAALETPLAFEGKVESLNVKGEGAATVQTLFSLVKGKAHFAYLVDPANAARHAGMLSLLTAAYGSGSKVRLEAKANAEGPPIALEIEIR
jgi:hypothetical protein